MSMPVVLKKKKKKKNMKNISKYFSNDYHSQGQQPGAAGDKLMICFLFSTDNRLRISCKLSTICIKYQSLFSGKNKKIFHNFVCCNNYPAYQFDDSVASVELFLG